MSAPAATDGGAVLVTMARGWIGTPYMHAAARRGAGCDCLGLLRGLWREWHGCEPESVPPYSPGGLDTGRDEALMAALSRHMRRLPPGIEGGPGTVLLFRLQAHAPARHVGLLSQPGPAARFIHAWERFGVIESPLGPAWARRVAARFAMT